MRSRRSVKPVIVIAIAIVAAVVLAMALREDRVYRVTVQPGQKITLDIETRMQRTFEHKRYAKERGLPVRCEVQPAKAASQDVTVRVVETGHRVHIMWATLEIAVKPDAKSGIHKRIADFTIDDQGNWPRVTILVRVTPH